MDERLIAAKHLIGRPGIRRVAPVATQFVHMLCDTHEMKLTNGTWSESYHSCAASIACMSQGPRQALLNVFPEFGDALDVERYGPLRRSVTLSGAAPLRT